MIDKIWEYRSRLYIALIIGMTIFALYSYIQDAKRAEDNQFIKEFRRLNASFCPPDIVPHPNLPEPNYPDPERPKDPNDGKSLIDMA